MHSMALPRKVIKIHKITLKEKLLKVYLQEDEFSNSAISPNSSVCRTKAYQISFNMTAQNLDTIFSILRNRLPRTLTFDLALPNASNVQPLLSESYICLKKDAYAVFFRIIDKYIKPTSTIRF